MTRILGLGVLVQILVCAAVGVHLLRLAGRTRELPEAAFGSAFLLLGAFGYPLAIVARGGAGGDWTAGWLFGVALGAQNLASLAIMLGTVHTFHAKSRVAQAMVWLAAALFAVSLAGHGLTIGFAGGRDGGAAYWLGFTLRFASFVWACSAAFNVHARLRRRVAIGLADAVAVDRIRLWALSTLGICTGFAVFGAARISGVHVQTSPLVLTVTSVVAIVSALAMTLAFFPPATYLQRVIARSSKA